MLNQAVAAVAALEDSERPKSSEMSPSPDCDDRSSKSTVLPLA